MSFIERKEWEGETCAQCGKDVSHETFVMDEQYFCCEECLGAYLVEKYEEDYEVVDFWTKGELLEEQREIHDDQERDYYEFYERRV